MPKQKVLIWTGEETMDQAQFLEAFKKVLEIVRKIQAETSAKLNEIISTFGSLSAKLDSDTSTAFSKNERVVAAELESLLRRFSTEQKKIDDKLMTIMDGKDADEIKIIQDVLTQIKLPEYKETVLDNANQIRNKLETLKDNERLDKSAIKGFEELIKELENKIIGSRRLGGGTPKTRMIPETPEGAINNSNTTFTIKIAPMIGHQLFLNGALQREGATYEYTMSGKTITYNTAPQTNSQHYIIIFK